jgi:hypothetical protein
MRGGNEMKDMYEIRQGNRKTYDWVKIEAESHADAAKKSGFTGKMRVYGPVQYDQKAFYVNHKNGTIKEIEWDD